MDYILKADSLQKSYGHFHALNGLSLKIPEGAIYGLVGKNGAGKTTLIRLICGLQEPTGGSYTLYGKKNSEKGISEVRRKVGAVVETPSIYLDMTAKQNVEQQNMILGKKKSDGADELLALVGLENTGNKKARNFSLGMRQRLGIAVALSGNPDFLVLDEPINGLDPQGIVEMRELILKLNRERHITFLISSHILDELSRLATHYCFVDGGKCVGEISADELEKNCRKYMHIAVSDIDTLSSVLDRLGSKYELKQNGEADIYSETDINTLVVALDNAGCKVLSLKCSDESLENYYMELVGVSTNE